MCVCVLLYCDCLMFSVGVVMMCIVCLLCGLYVWVFVCVCVKSVLCVNYFLEMVMW